MFYIQIYLILIQLTLFKGSDFKVETGIEKNSIKVLIPINANNVGKVFLISFINISAIPLIPKPINHTAPVKTVLNVLLISHLSKKLKKNRVETTKIAASSI